MVGIAEVAWFLRSCSPRGHGIPEVWSLDVM